jgi:hypothetical protein
VELWCFYWLFCALLYYAYRRGQKSVSVGSRRQCGELSNDKTVEMRGNGQLNDNQAEQKIYGDHEVGGASRYFDAEPGGLNVRLLNTYFTVIGLNHVSKPKYGSFCSRTWNLVPVRVS